MTKEVTALKTAWDPYEAELVQHARERSPEAWTVIYNDCYRPVYRYVRARVFDEAAAADIASSVFVEAIASIGSYEYRGRPILAWLYRIARNLVGTHQRKVLRSRNGGSHSPLDMPRRFAARFLRREQNNHNGDEAPAPADGIRGDPGELAGHLDLRQAIQALPKAQREVLVLRFLVGLRTPEIASVMGRQPVAIYSLQARALVALRRQLEHK